MKVSCRQMTVEDTPAVAAMEFMLFDYPTDQQGLIQFVNAPNQIGLVACYTTNWGVQRLAGYLLREARATAFHIHRIGVHPDYQRKGVGTTLMTVSLDAMNEQRRKTIVDVQETNLKACYFLKSMGFSSSLMRRMFDDDVDGVRFRMMQAVLA